MTLPAPAPAASPAPSPRSVRWAIVAIAIAAAWATTIGTGPAPTGDPAIDAWMIAIGVGAVTWIGGAALRWDAGAITLIAAITVGSLPLTVLGVAVAVVGYAAPVPRAARSLVTTALVGVAMNLAIRSELGGFQGAATIVTLALGGYVTAIGLHRRTRASRRAVAVAVAGAALVAVLGTVTLGVAGARAVDDLRLAGDLARDGLRSLRAGDIDDAHIAFDEAAAAFSDADRRFDTPMLATARFVPVVAQHQRAAAELSREAAAASIELGDELGNIDLDALSPAAGRIDLDEVRRLESPLAAIDDRIDSLTSTLDAIDSPWLVPAVAERLDELAADAAEHRERTADARSVVAAAPALLGGDGPRRYFVGFTTPAEARGSGGFMGNWAELTIDDGRFEMTDFGRSDDLNDAGDVQSRRFPDGVDDLDDWLDRYGPYNIASGPGGTTGPEVWKNINMSPDMTATGRAIAELYPQSGGRPIDGVFLLDVDTLVRFLAFTGPVDLPEGQTVAGRTVLTTGTAEAYLLNGQYDVPTTDERVDWLEAFSTAVVDELLAGALPPPDELADALGPAIDQGRLTAWASRPDEQQLFSDLGVAGTLRDPERGDSIAVTFNNAVGNKIDYFLDADLHYRAIADGASGTVDAALTVDLANRAPTAGEPRYVIGNSIGLPVGDNRTWVSVYTQLPVTGARLDGRAVEIQTGREAGHHVTSTFIRLPSGTSSSLTLELAGEMDLTHGYSLTASTPPTVDPTPLTLDLTWADGDRSGRHDSVIDEPGRHRVRVVATSDEPGPTAQPTD